MTIHSVYRPFLRVFRHARMFWLYELFHINGATSVLDVGGSGEFWRVATELGFPMPRMAIQKVLPPMDAKGTFAWAVADGAKILFCANSFDVAVSNSFIEHVGGFAMRLSFGEEVKRVAPNAFVQAPDYWCMVEPHVLALFSTFASAKIASPGIAV